MQDTERYFTNLTIFDEEFYILLEMDMVEWTQPEYYHQN